MTKAKKWHVARGLLTALLGTGIALSVSTACLQTARASAESDDGKYYADFTTYAEEQAAAEELAAEIGREGFVLLKNNGALPIPSKGPKATLFGDAAYDTVYGGGGSGSGSVNSYQTQKTIIGSLEDAGFSINPTVRSFYEDLGGEAELVSNPDAMKTVEGSYNYYDDAAIVVLAREGTEGSDQAMTTYENGKSNSDYSGTDYYKEDDDSTHSLELYPEELALLSHVKAQGFKRIVVMLNTSNALEAAVLEDDEEIDAVLWIGNPGAGGLEDLGEVLTGVYNPSGRMVDVYDADHTQDPTWYNFADNSQAGSDASGSIYYMSDGTATEWAGSSSNFGWGSSPRQQIEYEEGIYMGYRWYETAATVDGYYEEDDNSYAPGSDRDTAEKDAYYNRTNGVVYPFGYGQSYTSFDWEIQSSNASEGLTAKTTVTIKVKVTNTGDYAGKDVVEVYYNPPYSDGGIEKSPVNLITYAKTDELEPGESQTLTITYNAKDMASFDWNDANGNGFTGYELEAGTYEVSLRTDSHTAKEGCTLYYALGEDILYDGSTAEYNWNEEGTESTGKSNADARFSTEGDYYYSAAPQGEYADNVQYVSRASGEWGLPETPMIETSIVSEQDMENVMFQEDFTVDDDTEDDPWYVGNGQTTEAGWTQAETAASEDETIQLKSLVGVEYDIKIQDGELVQGTDEGTEDWNEFMDQFTLSELKNYLANSWTLGAIERAGMDSVAANDGPAKLKDGTYWPCCTLIASTWNTELAYKQGRMVGNEGLFQNCIAWFGPGANTHRSPFTGRNFEYYSSDGVQAGLICAQVVKGATDMGLIVTLKHNALNDQETNRQDNQGLVVWCNEQAMREIYFKPFEMSVTDGNGNAFMQSYTRFGAVGSDNNYQYQVEIIQNEWGFKGMFYSDMGGADNAEYHFRTGGTHGINTYTDSINGTWNTDGYVEVTGASSTYRSDTQYAAIRLTAMRWMYTEVNAATNRNMVDTDAFTDQSGTVYELTKNVSSSISVGVDLNTLNAYEAYYTITSGSLPDGMSFDESTGTISGTPTTTGTYSVTVTLTADRYVTTTSSVYSTDATFTIVVSSTFTMEEVDWVVGEESEALVSNSAVSLDSGYSSITYSLTGAPDWMAISEDGYIYGTPTEAGTYEFTVVLTAGVESTDWFGNVTTSYSTYTETFTITVTGTATEEEETGITAEELQAQISALEEEIAALETQISGLSSESGEAETSSVFEETSSEGGSGCGSVIDAGSVAVIAAVSLAAAAVCVKTASDRKKNSK